MFMIITVKELKSDLERYLEVVDNEEILITKDGKLYSIGGRVLSLCTNSDDPFPVLKAFAKNVKMEHKYYRKDIHIS